MTIESTSSQIENSQLEPFLAQDQSCHIKLRSLGQTHQAVEPDFAEKNLDEVVKDFQNRNITLILDVVGESIKKFSV